MNFTLTLYIYLPPEFNMSVCELWLSVSHSFPYTQHGRQELQFLIKVQKLQFHIFPWKMGVLARIYICTAWANTACDLYCWQKMQKFLFLNILLRNRMLVHVNICTPLGTTACNHNFWQKMQNLLFKKNSLLKSVYY